MTTSENITLEQLMLEVFKEQPDMQLVMSSIVTKFIDRSKTIKQAPNRLKESINIKKNMLKKIETFEKKYAEEFEKLFDEYEITADTTFQSSFKRLYTASSFLISRALNDQEKDLRELNFGEEIKKLMELDRQKIFNITLEDFMDATGLDYKLISSITQSLVDKGYVTRTAGFNGFHYKILDQRILNFLSKNVDVL